MSIILSTRSRLCINFSHLLQNTLILLPKSKSTIHVTKATKITSCSHHGTFLPLFATSFKHVDTEDNNSFQTFNFNDENWAKAQVAISHYPPQYKAAAIAQLLDLAQRQCGGWLPLSAMDKVAIILEVTPMQVYEVASFYTMFNRVPIGKNFVQICGTTPCHTMGAPSIKKAIMDRLGIQVGQTTKDGLFTLLEVECLGACVNAPMMQINDHYYEDLTPESAVMVIDQLAAGQEPKPGPQHDRRRVAEPAGEKTSLKEEPLGPYAPYLEELDAKDTLPSN